MSKKEKILRYLHRGGKLTVAKALTKFGCYALSQRVNEARREGLPIKVEMITTRRGDRIAEYSLERKEAP